MNTFWDGFEKRALKEVGTVALLHGKSVLMGKRNDNGRWTFPGGHLDRGEKPADGAAREVYEEAGVKLKPEDLTHLNSEDLKLPNGKPLRVHAYKVVLKSKPTTTTEHDPDDEIDGSWQWVPANLPKEIANNLHVPAKRNILIKNLEGIVKAAVVRYIRRAAPSKDTVRYIAKEIPQQYAQNLDRFEKHKKNKKQ